MAGQFLGGKTHCSSACLLESSLLGTGHGSMGDNARTRWLNTLAIDHFESDLNVNAVVPIALAHRYTAISLSPGGRVLDILTKDALET